MIRNERFEHGVCVEAEVIDLDAGTVTIEKNGKVSGTRPLTADEAARHAPPVLDPLATLIADLSKATTLAAVRAAATKAADL